MKEYNFTNPELIKKLKEKGVKNPKGGTKKLQRLCRTNNIAVSKQVIDIEPGWINKAKGAFQILYERGWINPSLKPSKYTWKGQMDGFGNRNLTTSIKAVIACQPDFINQKTLLQHFCELLGTKSDRTPVAHCEIAGEGIEFDWGYSKMLYRSKPISMKRNKTKFHELVDSVLSTDVLTIAVARANSCRARQYMLVYTRY